MRLEVLADPVVLELRDIQGLDGPFWWPPAPGWYLSIGALIAATLLFLLLRWLFRLARGWILRDWRRDARRRFLQLRYGIDSVEGKTFITELSELIRRVAIARCGRYNCAGLSGEAWLRWLKRWDPRRFDWVKEGRCLLEVPYAPPGVTVDRRQMRRLLRAGLAWVDASPRGCRRRTNKRDETASEDEITPNRERKRDRNRHKEKRA